MLLREALEQMLEGRPPCRVGGGGKQAQAAVAAPNMAALFSAGFLVAVTQHAGSSHVIIGGEMETHGN